MLLLKCATAFFFLYNKLVEEGVNINKMNILYISIEGNTNHFLNKMQQLFHNVSLHRITDQSDLFRITTPFFCFVPTYVKGTQLNPNSSNAIQEIDTLTLNDELGYQQNYKKCLGLVGSGNKNFGIDCYCWTARHYQQKYKVPVIDNYEIRGALTDENRINHKMTKIWNNKVSESSIPFKPTQNINPRLKKLEKKYKK